MVNNMKMKIIAVMVGVILLIGIFSGCVEETPEEEIEEDDNEEKNNIRPPMTVITKGKSSLVVLETWPFMAGMTVVLSFSVVNSLMMGG